MSERVEVNREYRVQSPKQNSYRVTIPKKLVKRAGVSGGEELGVEVNIKDQNAVIDYKAEPSDDMVTREVVKPHNMVRIPSAIGNALQLSREMISWSMIRDGSDVTLRVDTDYIPPKVGSNWDKLDEQKLNPTKDEDREHFSLYLRKTVVDELGWSDNTEIGFLICRESGEPAIRCQPVDDEPSDLRKSDVSTVTSSSEQLRFYLPRSLVRALGLQNERIEIESHRDVATVTE